jgi:hypothetical protein
MSNIKSDVAKIRLALDDDLKHKFLQRLTHVDYGEQHSEVLRQRAAKTGQWLLGSTEYQE